MRPVYRHMGAEATSRVTKDLMPRMGAAMWFRPFASARACVRRGPLSSPTPHW